MKDRVPESNNEHRDIILALLKDDLEAARALLKAHLKSAREVAYLSMLESSPTAQ